MVKFDAAVISNNSTIRDAIGAIDRGQLQIALVVDANYILVGTVTDGDIRRAILKGLEMNQSVTLIMNQHPTTGTPAQSRAELLALMKPNELRHIPIVETNGRLFGLELLNESPSIIRHENTVIIMAGGLGKRLGSLTSEVPKPMLPVKNRPLLESIIEFLKGYGFHEIYISVNYKRNIIQDYFGDGSKHEVNIKYIEEDSPLGTAGSLSLLKVRPKNSLLVMNADLVTNLNLNALLEFHKKQNSYATICVRDHDLQIPYGVIKMDKEHRVLSLEEKPKMRFFANAGIYILEPSCLDYIPYNSRFDMTDLLDLLLQENRPVAAFPIRETWVDIGQAEDFERANKA